jgi:GTP-binding protein
MKILSSRFIKSASKLSGCPKPQQAEFAFIGRSNVGKSSLINMLCGNKNLAKTSATPGKTKLINFFLINEEWFLVDLPGYGYARVGKSQKEVFEKIISDYCCKRDSLVNLFVLVDSRLPLQQIDSEFMNWCGENSIPFVIVFTKTDKLTRQQLQKNLSAYRKALGEWWEECPPIMITSAEKAVGRDEITDYIFRFKDALK